MIPYNLYLETMRKYNKPLGNHVVGVDVNVDRTNLVMVDRHCRLRDVKIFWFREITSRGYRRKTAWTKIHQAIHDMLRSFPEYSLLFGNIRFIVLPFGSGSHPHIMRAIRVPLNLQTLICFNPLNARFHDVTISLVVTILFGNFTHL